MEQLVWLVAYVAGFGLLQVALYRLFKQRTASATEGSSERAGGRRLAATEETEAVPCRHCGTVNEIHQAVRYCRACTESIR
jgi:hypothetical protein